MHVRELEIVADGVRTPVREIGPRASRQAVVFLHGNPGSSRDWADLLQRVGTFARGVALDMPGFGRSRTPWRYRTTLPDYARFLADALDVLGIDRVHLVAHDFGGPWGLFWAKDHPEALHSVVLINTGLPHDYEWHRAAQLWRKPVVGELLQIAATRSQFTGAVRRLEPDTLPEWFVHQMYDDYTLRTKWAVLQLYRATETDVGEPYVDRFAALDRPALVLWGNRDKPFPVEQAYHQRRPFPSAEIIEIEGAGHWPFIERPDEVAAHLLPFLREQVTDAPPTADA